MSARHELDDQLFVIDKEPGPTSFDIVARFRRATGLRRVGHTGTLDPSAEGVLVLCTGLATRAAEYVMNLEKTYEFDVVLGVGTDTLDATGEIVASAPVPALSAEEIAATAASFEGEYTFRPPAYSAVKQDGRPMYRWAREGKAREAAQRVVTVYEFKVTSVDLPKVTCVVRCSRGTYVRSLAADLGARFELPAHIGRLARTRVGRFTREEAFAAARLLDGDLSDLRGYGVGEAVAFLPAVVLKDEACPGLFAGALPEPRDVIRTEGALATSGPVRIVDERGNLLAIGRRRPGRDDGHLVDTFRLFVRREPT